MRDIDKTVKDILTPCGFVFKKHSWYRVSDDFINIINFQKSQFSNKFYMNLGVDERTGQKIKYKPEHLFSVRLRVDMIILDKQLLDALDFESDCSETSRKEKLEILSLNGVTFLDSINGWKKIKSAMNSKIHPVHRAFITASFIKKINGDHNS